ncbi:TPA: 5'/3'-nucleotidase SurE [Legionella pneumophila subsp. pneumophila]|uniref:5'-nucleotidase SurE n=2 Tax=Legionella pneumophila TaxID=446 RepID=SURE_LEGPL|nr:5'/3'-nucleotidase SurE [Legionella pneumophila]Q5WX53.1 RecName: Full=5'-nucleotidase SurE; AltName: Full=Nucleoside 5'-monophosphate phosphohydrolase [Legionella pneumophila str. Lens]AMV14020.1 5'-nucleotidase SurE [Legionella pneumophila]ANN92281.1 5'/3'-nucleotidase SurE [Legionella pneumophila]AOW52159.1 5'/3'-nucleotidase SurE [Legionella pneumophila subsp. pneumophila]AOW54252.1 5'/3'-nucleotidase SurE [Legionella pneumophila subsp. pneumophila]AOW57457.1 5'/3'-nucleotidase SurE [L
MKILVSNDDGVLAPGIKILANELSTLGEVKVVAPDRNRSGASNSLTLTQPLRVKQLDNGYYSVDGTPTDCVHLALTGFLEPMADIVVSGINEGANLGDDVLYSGTVAAAMEGRYLGLPAIAISMVGDNIQHYETAAIIAKQLVIKLSANKLPSQTILNVNVPDLPLNQIRGLQVTRLGTRHSAEPIIKEYDPRGRPIYWVGPPGIEADAGAGTDFFAIKTGHVSITPLHLDMTHYKLFDHLSNLLNEICIEN